MVDPRTLLGRVPWWTIAVLAHLCAFLLLSQTGGCLSQAPEPEWAVVGLFEGEMGPGPPGEFPGAAAPGPAMPAVEQTPPSESMVQLPLVEPAAMPTPSPTNHLGTPDLADLLGRGAPAGATMGLLGPRQNAVARAEAVRAFRGSQGSERAVDRGLRWLALHQDGNGSWSRRDYTRHCPRNDQCESGVTACLDEDLDPAVTGLALLAFLGRGYAPDVESPYQDTVKRGVEYLLRMQGRDGRYGAPNAHQMYVHGIVTLALSEAAILTGDARLRSSVSRAAALIAEAQQAAGGWDYTSAKTGRSDTTVTGWQVLALKSASVAGADVPLSTVYGAIRLFDRQTAANGDVPYALGDAKDRRSTSMIAVALVARQFLGWSRTSPQLIVQAERLLRDLPDWDLMLAAPSAGNTYHSTYYWYYGTLAMFHMGGRYWERWNEGLRDLLVRRQTGFGHRAGSWEPLGLYCEVGGRVYNTALSILNLEIYYRYLPLYRSDGGTLGARALRLALRQSDDANERAAIIYDLGQMQDREAEAAITAALDDPSMSVRFEAGAILARQGREAGRQVLAQAAAHSSSFIRARALDVLTALDETWVVPILIDRLTDSEPLLTQRAAEGLRRITGKSFPFDPKGTSAERGAALVAWRAWWRDYQAQRPGAPAVQQLGAVVATRTGADVVVFGLSSGAQVQVGQLVWLYRGDEWIAIVRVSEVLPGMAAGSILRTAPGRSVERDDQVSNRPGGPVEGP
jgi:hypothetical protein